MHTIPPNICSLDIPKTSLTIECFLDIPKTSLTIEVKATLNISGNIDLNQNISFWESKGQSTLVMTFDPDILDNYTKLKGIYKLQVMQIVGH